MTPEQLANIKRKGALVIRDVVDDAQATEWKASLDEFVKTNPSTDGGHFQPCTAVLVIEWIMNRLSGGEQTILQPLVRLSYLP